MPTPSQQTQTVGECRQCRTWCDRLIDPAGCVAIGCPFLYSYEDARSGARYMGCMQKVFKAEIDVDAFHLAEQAGGFGGIKAAGRPLPQCQFHVERAYEGEGPAYECVNPRFFDYEEAEDGFSVFDLRRALT